MSQVYIFMLGRGKQAAFAMLKHAQKWQVGHCLHSVNLKSKVAATFPGCIIKPKQWLPQSSVLCCQAEAFWEEQQSLVLWLVFSISLILMIDCLCSF